MKNDKMENSEFHDFFVDALKDIYWAEQHVAKALPKFQKASTSEELAGAFRKHEAETQGQIRDVEKIFELLGEKAQAKKCDAMEGLLKEAQSVIEDTERDTFTRDAGLILAAQKIEHYEIATYGTLRAYAGHMGHREVERLLDSILQNEKYSDAALTKIAGNSVNAKAAKE